MVEKVVPLLELLKATILVANKQLRPSRGLQIVKLDIDEVF